MIQIEQAIIVEGKYDKIKLSALVDAVILQTDGFRIFKDKEKRELIRVLAKTKGIVILTDSDTAGFQIRSFIKSIARDGCIQHIYIPEIFGKEKRKVAASKEGTLGVEGINNRILIEAFEKAGIGCPAAGEKKSKRPITKLDFYTDGLTGAEKSAEKRRALMKRLDLPHYLSTNALLEIVNVLIDYESYQKLLDQL